MESYSGEDVMEQSNACSVLHYNTYWNSLLACMHGVYKTKRPEEE